VGKGKEAFLKSLSLMKQFFETNDLLKIFYNNEALYFTNSFKKGSIKKIT
jgi:hypothetical protein